MGLAHLILGFYYRKASCRFEKELQDCERVQRSKLKKIIEELTPTRQWGRLNPEDSYEVLCHKVPLADYGSYEALIKEQRNYHRQIISKDIVRYEPTSGSTNQRKWIPYSEGFLSEINLAAAAWLGGIYSDFPEIEKGRHYWSLSWLPKELRGEMSSDDADLFPLYQRMILKKAMAVPSDISLLESPEAAWHSTLIYLAAAKDLTLVSVWSPTFFLRVIEDLKSNWDQIRMSLESGQWLSFAQELKKAGLKAPRRKFSGTEFPGLQVIWPNLKVLSSWDSSSSQMWADQLKVQFPDAHFQGKGLWATEGVVSIPFQSKKVLALQSHFFEFKDLQTEEILPAWQLSLGKFYQPILWTSSGLLRYALSDRVEVVGFIGNTPCFEFKGRIQSTDLVGEKIDAQWVQDLFNQNPHWNGWTLAAMKSLSPHYVLFHSSKDDPDIEGALQNLHHYKVAREIGQLQAAKAFRVDNVFDVWKRIGKSQIAGQNKVEILVEVQVVT